VLLLHVPASTAEAILDNGVENYQQHNTPNSSLPTYQHLDSDN
jgi:hypothetical protein